MILERSTAKMVTMVNVTDIDRDPIDLLVADYAIEHHCPTVSWGVVLGDVLAATGSAGAASADAVSQEPVSEETVYRIASMTKSFSAAATLILRDEGVLQLDDPIGRHAPDLAALRSGTSDAPPITIRDLLSMTSGLVEDDAWADRHLDLTDDEFDAIIAAGPVFAQPTGVRFEYSNLGYAVLGRVVHRASGRRIQDIVTDRLLRPLGMTRSSWVQPDHDDWTRPFDWNDDRFVEEIPTPDDGLIAPMGGIWTTVADLAKWITWMSDGFPARDGSDDGPLSRASRREMQMIQRYVGQRTLRGVRSPTGYGLGLRILDEAMLGNVVTHSGGLPGYGSSMRWLPGRGIGVIALSNVTYAPMTELTALILDVLHEQGHVPERVMPINPVLPDLAARLVGLLNKWDDDNAESILADNVAMDSSYAQRQAAVDRLLTLPITLGKTSTTDFASATVTCSDATGREISITFSLAPIHPERIQEYEIAVR